MLVIKQLTSADIPQLLHVETAAHITPWSEPIFRDCFKENYYGWALKKENVIVGFIMITLRAEECEILNLCIHPTWQRTGYGRKLLNYALQQAQALGVTMAFLEVRRSNRAAIDLYLSVGFNELDVRKNYYKTSSGYEDAILMGYHFRY